MATVYERVRAVVVDKLGVEESQVTEDASFEEDLKADSLDLVELIMALEEEFSTEDEKFEISDEEAGTLHTVGDAVKYIEQRLAGRTAAA